MGSGSVSVGRQGSAGEHGKRASEAIDGNGQTDDPLTSDSVAGIPGAVGSTRALRDSASWLSGTRLGLAVMALIVGAVAGLAAALFRWLIYAFTWLVTGHRQFGQQVTRPACTCRGLACGSCLSSRWWVACCMGH